MNVHSARELARVHQALAEPNRIRILKMLEIRPLCVCEITAVLQLAASTVSKHLSILREAGFIVDHKDGKWVNYQLNEHPDPKVVGTCFSHLARLLTNDETVLSDAEKVRSVDRHQLCK
ncbi:MAG: winged helix-turn-helix transcriptional regulator [Fidelibacterota bacterium]|nr:MAG: winged helix-turn-helix transcriptional regulator [Candidatus Neomarinimicrobiota bacterium]